MSSLRFDIPIRIPSTITAASLQQTIVYIVYTDGVINAFNLFIDLFHLYNILFSFFLYLSTGDWPLKLKVPIGINQKIF